MKKTIAALAICLFAAGAAHAAMPQTPNTITPDLLAEATVKLNNPPAENPAGTEQQNDQTPKESPEPESSNTTAQNSPAPEQEAAVKTPANVKTAEQGTEKGKNTVQQQVKQPRVVRRTVKIEPAKENWYLTKPADFTYYVNKTTPSYSLAIPTAFGADLLTGLPAEGPMITRGADDTTAMMFNASLPDGKAAVFKDALAGKQLMAPPAPVTRHLKEKGEEIIEITEFEAPPQYSYRQVNTEALNLPPQLQNLVLTEAGEYKTFQGLSTRYMQFKCSSGNVPCLLRLTLTQHSGYQYTGFYLFPENKRLTFIPLADYSARSLQCGQSSLFDKY